MVILFFFPLLAPVTLPYLNDLPPLPLFLPPVKVGKAKHPFSPWGIHKYPIQWESSPYFGFGFLFKMFFGSLLSPPFQILSWCIKRWVTHSDMPPDDLLCLRASSTPQIAGRRFLNFPLIPKSQCDSTDRIYPFFFLVERRKMIWQSELLYAKCVRMCIFGIDHVLPVFPSFPKPLQFHLTNWFGGGGGPPFLCMRL